MTTLERLQRASSNAPQLVRHDFGYYLRNVLLGIAIWGAITVPLACASASVEAQVLGEGPVVAPTPTRPYIVIEGDPMPRLFLDYYLPAIKR